MVMYGQPNQLEEMHRVLDEMENFRFDRTKKTFLIMYKEYSKAGRRSEAEILVGMMCKYGFLGPKGCFAFLFGLENAGGNVCARKLIWVIWQLHLLPLDIVVEHEEQVQSSDLRVQQVSCCHSHMHQQVQRKSLRKKKQEKNADFIRLVKPGLQRREKIGVPKPAALPPFHRIFRAFFSQASRHLQRHPTTNDERLRHMASFPTTSSASSPTAKGFSSPVQVCSSPAQGSPSPTTFFFFGAESKFESKDLRSIAKTAAGGNTAV
ncbi:hypothetical protein KSP40_PGU012713 [Platanthera guangdongensis]|uniref:Pentatricopeptide repeat-containing protein n=1 Tax=Platanthera guangdongensis TaxID=2320717 RepID=A0ABR2LJL6_9ASPA